MIAAAGRTAYNDQVGGIELIYLVGFEIELTPIVQSDINSVPFSGKQVYKPLVILDTIEITVLGSRHPDDIRPGRRGSLGIFYMQQRRSFRGPIESLGFSSSRGGFVRVVSKEQHYRIAGGPIGLVDYLLDDTGDVRSLLIRTLLLFYRPLRYIPHYRGCRYESGANVERIFTKCNGIGTSFTLDDKGHIGDMPVIIDIIGLKLHPRTGDCGALGNLDIQQSDTYRL
ncbi:hypothetical protein ES703_116182 [subsurface metagenome]